MEDYEIIDLMKDTKSSMIVFVYYADAGMPWWFQSMMGNSNWLKMLSENSNWPKVLRLKMKEDF